MTKKQEKWASWRRHIHHNPELAFEEFETAEFLIERLNEIGCDSIVSKFAETGIIAELKGSAGEGPSIALRADMDALMIEEKNDLHYKSKNQGKMHACGHDGHTAMLLGAAKYLSETRNFDGTVVLIFQPAEEGQGGLQAADGAPGGREGPGCPGSQEKGPTKLETKEVKIRFNRDLLCRRP